MGAAGGLARCVMDGFSNTHGAYPYPGPNTTVGRAFLLETITSFALVLVVLNTATVAKTSGNGYFGVAIGFTVSSMAFFAGGISGGAFNPAVHSWRLPLEITWQMLGRFGYTL